MLYGLTANVLHHSVKFWIDSLDIVRNHIYTRDFVHGHENLKLKYFNTLKAYTYPADRFVIFWRETKYPHNVIGVFVYSVLIIIFLTTK